MDVSRETRAVRIGRTDNAAVALEDLRAGESVLGVRLTEDIARGHKFALADIPQGSPVVKYDMPVGRAKTRIRAGGFIHSHNLATALSGELEYTYSPAAPAPVREEMKGRVFRGFRRPDGACGVRNDLWIVPTVGCVNTLAENLAKAFSKRLPEGDVDRVLALTHPCGCSQLGEDHRATAEILADFVRHPNAGGVLVVALGCENNTLESFRERLKGVDPGKVRFLRAQDEGDEFESGMKLLEELLVYAGSFRRTDLPVSELRIGLKCGGSDGLSGITANPLIGRISDLLAGAGGTTVLTEVPEMFGAETLLMNRCENRRVFEKCVRMVNGFKEYFLKNGQPVYENPSPGNKAGGITTLEEKSLGCTQKGGTGIVRDVLAYGERLRTHGLNLLSGPGNDMAAVTALAASGAQIILFSTGRGTPFGGPVPTLKISTNSVLAAAKPKWIDFDAGVLVSGASMDGEAEKLFDLLLETASGTPARNEEWGYQEIALFKNGVTL